MDFKSKNDRLKENWPTGSLERILGEFGAKSLKEAVAKAMDKKREVMPKEDPDFEQMQKIIREMVERLEKIDIDRIDPIKRRKLSQMPLDSIKNALRWKEEWLKVLEGVYGSVPVHTE